MIIHRKLQILLLVLIIALPAIGARTDSFYSSKEEIVGDSIAQDFGTVKIKGEHKKTRLKITFSIGGPLARETDTHPNLFLDYLISVSFSNGEDTITLPGFFAAYGERSNTSANPLRSFKEDSQAANGGESTPVANIYDVSIGQMTYYVQINNTGIYDFDWRVAINQEDSRSEHTEAWLKIGGVKHFYGVNEEGHKLKPRPYCEGGTELECPNKEEGLVGYLKIYRGMVRNFYWQSCTSDVWHHKIEIEVDQPGIITIYLLGRSFYQSIDRIVLYKNDKISSESAKDMSNVPSEINHSTYKQI
ncbi:hypothetical protein [Reichenbachiella ulvae]|uniref:Uncharacterized protein n=1 Tax=Reichenbachiella ulvae TaxID=2980104 RepID=A0ABT3CSV5_9BACT|nr:hypothetical protein [Reichenbachiella ulvae]MCV9386671.1 hypothetical protein [Reichenbachiella ulvae]